MNRHILPFLLALCLVPVFILGLRSDPNELPSAYIGKPIPTFDLPNLIDDRKRVTSQNLAGNMAVVNIWATWCGGCRAEHEFLMQLSEQLEIPIYGIGWRDDRQRALQWLAELGDPYVATGFDADGRIGIAWGAYGAPETFLVDSNGIVLHRFTGPLNWSQWQNEFVPLIAKASAQ